MTLRQRVERAIWTSTYSDLPVPTEASSDRYWLDVTTDAVLEAIGALDDEPCRVCRDAGYVTESEHGCDGDERRCLETCPIPVQRPCPGCSTVARPVAMTTDEEPF